MNNNLSTERAHLGLFSTSSYISIGDTYGKKAAGDARLLGKQFSHEAPKEGTGGKLAANCLFEREYKVLYNGEKYVDRTSYLKTQPLEGRKKAFGSSDAKKRDEFSNDMETSKWRERIKGEMEFAAMFAKRAEGNMSEEDLQMMAELESRGKEPRWTHGPKHLFDLGKEATGGVTPYEMKDSRDTWYSKHRVQEMNGGTPFLGNCMLSSHAVGDNLQGYSDWAKPEFARQPIIRDSFFRSTGVLRP